MSIYLRNVLYVDWKSLLFTKGHMRVDEGVNAGFEFVDIIPEGSGVIDCKGKLITHSFAIGHHHIYSTLARGMPAPKHNPTSFQDILKYVWWNLDKQLDSSMIRVSALVCAIEAAKSGCTFIIDHHSSPNAANDSLHIIAEALEEVGLSHLLCYELSDRDGPESLKKGLDETAAYLSSHNGLVGLHASFTVSDSLLAKAVNLAAQYNTGIHIHVAEDLSDQKHCIKNYNCTVGERLCKAGALSHSATILAHCLHLSDGERALISDSNAWVVHSTESNHNNAVGSFIPNGLGDHIFIGTDGMHSSMIAAARAMYLEGQMQGGLTIHAAYRRMRSVHDYIAYNKYSGDAANNLVILNYDSPTPVTPDNWCSHFLFGIGREHVETVISNGKIIVNHGEVLFVDQAALFAEARAQAEILWGRL